MNNFFKDAVVDELESSDAGWLTLAIEPYTYSLVDKLFAADLEESYTLTYADLIETIDSGPRHVEIKKPAIIQGILDNNNITDITSRELCKLAELTDHNSFRLSDSVHIDFGQKQLNGTIEFVTPVINEDDILKLVLRVVRDELRDLMYEGKFDIKKYNEVMSILECKEHLNSKSRRRKNRSIVFRFMEILENDTWRIRSGDLMIKAAKWLVQACAGNTHGIANFTKLKCMTYSGKVIYSMEEIV